MTSSSSLRDSECITRLGVDSSVSSSNLLFVSSFNATTLLLSTVPQSQGDPKIVKRGPNFGQKGDPKGTHFDVKGDLKFEFFRIVHKERICKNSREIKLKFLQRWSIFTCRATSWAKGHFYFLIVKWSTNDTGSYYFAFFSLK